MQSAQARPAAALVAIKTTSVRIVTRYDGPGKHYSRISGRCIPRRYPSLTDWRAILLAGDKGAEVAADRKAEATSMSDTDKWRARETRLDELATFAMLAIEFDHD